MNSIKIWLLGVSLGSLMACTTNPLFDVGPQQLDALAYFDWVMSASAEQRAAEVWLLEQEAPASDSLDDRVRLIVLSSAFSDDRAHNRRAIAQLVELDGSDEQSFSADYRVFAQLWRQYLEQRESLQATMRQLREAEEQRGILRRQIEALTSIEEQLNRRGTKP